MRKTVNKNMKHFFNMFYYIFIIIMNTFDSFILFSHFFLYFFVFELITKIILLNEKNFEKKNLFVIVAVYLKFVL